MGADGDWDGEESFLVLDDPTGTWIAIAIHSTRLGPAVGGTRMRVYRDPGSALADARRLSAAMTLKFAVPGLPWGGGKAVLAVPEGLPGRDREGLLRRFGTMIADLRGRYRTAPDAGTTSEDMDVIAATAGPYVFGRTVANGGAGPSGPATALGVLAAIEVTCEERFGTPALEGRRVVVQGAGSVGGALVAHLVARGADVLVAETGPAALRRALDAGAGSLPPGDAVSAGCDVLSPCAYGGVVGESTVARLACGAIAGGANNPLDGAAVPALLAARGILYAPDFVASVGGAMAGVRMEADGWPRERAEAEVTERVRATLRRVYAIARERGTDPESAARSLARQRLEGGA